MREISGVWLRIAPRPTLIFLLSANIRKEIQKGANNVIIFTGSMVTGGAEAMKAALKLGEAVKHLPKKGE